MPRRRQEILKAQWPPEKPPFQKILKKIGRTKNVAAILFTGYSMQARPSEQRTSVNHQQGKHGKPKLEPQNKNMENADC